MPIHAMPIEHSDEELPLQRSNGLPPTNGPALRPHEEALPPPMDLPTSDARGKTPGKAAEKSTAVTLTAAHESTSAPHVPEIRFHPAPGKGWTGPAAVPLRLPPAVRR
jgi:hypothetical protein